MLLQFKRDDQLLLVVELDRLSGARQVLSGDDSWLDYSYSPPDPETGEPLSISADPERWARALALNYIGSGVDLEIKADRIGTAEELSQASEPGRAEVAASQAVMPVFEPLVPMNPPGGAALTPPGDQPGDQPVRFADSLEKFPELGDDYGSRLGSGQLGNSSAETKLLGLRSALALLLDLLGIAFFSAIILIGLAQIGINLGQPWPLPGIGFFEFERWLGASLVVAAISVAYYQQLLQRPGRVGISPGRNQLGLGLGLVGPKIVQEPISRGSSFRRQLLLLGLVGFGAIFFWLPLLASYLYAIRFGQPWHNRACSVRQMNAELIEQLPSKNSGAIRTDPDQQVEETELSEQSGRG